MTILSGSIEKIVARKGNHKILEIVDFKGRKWFYLMTKDGVLLRRFTEFDQAHSALVSISSNRNPGAAWHLDREIYLDNLRKKLKVGSSYTNMLTDRILENDFAHDASMNLGVNPQLSYYDLSQDERSCLLHAKHGGAVYLEDNIYWKKIAKGLVKRKLLRWSSGEHAFLLTARGKEAVKDLGLTNPGAAWHKQKFNEYLNVGGHEHQLLAQANLEALHESRRLGIPNPRTKPISKYSLSSILPLILIVSFGYLWWKNRISQ